MNTPLLVIFLSLVPAVLWGLSPIASKKGLSDGGNEIQAATTVIVVDTLVFWTALLTTSSGSPFEGINFQSILIFAVAGLVGTALGRVIVFIGVDRVGASINSAAISTRPLFGTAVAFLWLGESVGLFTGIGVIILVSGLVVLAVSRGGDVHGWEVRDLLFPIGAAAMFGIGNVIRRFGFLNTQVTPLQAVTVNETAALISIVLYLFASDNEFLQSSKNHTNTLL